MKLLHSVLALAVIAVGARLSHEQALVRSPVGVSLCLGLLFIGCVFLYAALEQKGEKR